MRKTQPDMDNVPDITAYLLATLQSQTGADCVLLQRIDAPPAFENDTYLHPPLHPLAETLSALDWGTYLPHTEPFSPVQLTTLPTPPHDVAVQATHWHSPEGAIWVLAAALPIAATHNGAAHTISQALYFTAQLIANQQATQHQREQTLSHALVDAVWRRAKESSSIQQVIDAIVPWLSHDNLSMMGVLFYGPLTDERPQGPFDFLEISGLWTRNHEGIYGAGSRFYIGEQNPIVAQLIDEGIFYSSDPRLADAIRADSVLGGFARSKAARHWIAFALHTERRHYGVLLIATDAPQGWSAAQIERYRALAEVLTLAMAYITLLGEHAVYQQGRSALLNAVNDSVMIVYPAPNGSIVGFVNERFRQVFGYNGEAHGARLDDLLEGLQIPNTVRQALEHQWKSIPLRDHSPQRGEFAFPSAQGQPIDIEWHSAPIYDADNRRVIARLYTFHDISSERAAVQVRSAFLSRVSHELRTPLTAISGSAQLILDAESAQLPPLAREYTDIILKSANHLKQVFTELIEITRAYAGETHLQLLPANLEDAVQSVLRQQAPYLKARGQHAQLLAEMPLPPLMIDAERIAVVLAHLLQNANLYAPPNSRISITLRHISAAHELPPHAPDELRLPCALLCVQDEGAGITESERERIFEPFYRARNAHAQQISGTGLGLAVCRSIIELHRGKIWAQSGQGGKFFVCLPL